MTTMMLNLAFVLGFFRVIKMKNSLVIKSEYFRPQKKKKIKIQPPSTLLLLAPFFPQSSPWKLEFLFHKQVIET
jgi:hypothetical protein